MKRRFISLMFLILLLLFPLSIAYPCMQDMGNDSCELSTKTTIYVDDSNTQGPWNGSYDYPYQYITDGILHASDGDTVYVFSGLYLETVCVNKSIYLRGQSQENTIIDGENAGSVVTITTDSVYLRRFTIRNSAGYQGDAGIKVTADFTSISECSVYRTRAGISVENNTDTIITSSRFHTNGFGVLFSSSAFATIDSCLFYHNGIGVYLYETQLITIINSYADTNGIGFLCERSSNIEITGSV